MTSEQMPGCVMGAGPLSHVVDAGEYLFCRLC